MYRLAVCEDEDGMRFQLHTLCEEILAEMAIPFEITTYSSAETLEAAFAEQRQYDLLLLDIQMDGKTGIELAHDLRNQNNRTSIIFITGSEEYLREGYSVQPIQYLLKPITREMLAQAIAIDRKINHSQQTVTLCTGSKTVTLPITEIRYIEILNHRLHIHMTDGEQSFLRTMAEMEQMLPTEQFCRCHNSFLVNMGYIKEISRTGLTLRDGTKLPVGRQFYNHMQSSFIRYMN